MRFVRKLRGRQTPEARGPQHHLIPKAERIWEEYLAEQAAGKHDKEP